MKLINLFRKKTATIREVTRILGFVISSFPAVEYGPLYYRDTEMEKIQALKVAKGDFESSMAISNNIKTELSWWIDNVHTQERKIQKPNPDKVLKCDASMLGYGAVLEDHKTGGRWTETEQNNHINYLELLAILYALKVT